MWLFELNGSSITAARESRKFVTCVYSRTSERAYHFFSTETPEDKGEVRLDERSVDRARLAVDPEPIAGLDRRLGEDH